MKPIFIHSVDTEKEALQQFNQCCNEDFVISAALMPDAHTGYVAPIGSVIKTNNAIVPSWVGYDIGCGMIAVKVSDSKEHQDIIKDKAQELFNHVNTVVPMGAGVHSANQTVCKWQDKNMQIIANSTLRDLADYVIKATPFNLGTLGGGNHFIEVLEYEAETWLVIHSGSRGVGHRVGEYFMKAASGLDRDYEATFYIKDEAMKNEYMLYQNYCLLFALENRMKMAKLVQQAIYQVCGFTYDTDVMLWTNKNHNHCIDIGNGEFLHRKGATSSELGERGVIPANMRDGCYLVEGLGNASFLNSSSHGAGRQMSRGFAKKNVTLEQFQQQMVGITAPVLLDTIDESPSAYKDIDIVMSLQKESVKIVKHLKPIINWKGFGKIKKQR